MPRRPERTPRNDTEVDPECAPLDLGVNSTPKNGRVKALSEACLDRTYYITGNGREIDCDTVMANNFAFGGVNTSLIFKKWKGQ